MIKLIGAGPGKALPPKEPPPPPPPPVFGVAVATGCGVAVGVTVGFTTSVGFATTVGFTTSVGLTTTVGVNRGRTIGVGVAVPRMGNRTLGVAVGGTLPANFVGVARIVRVGKMNLLGVGVTRTGFGVGNSLMLRGVPTTSFSGVGVARIEGKVGLRRRFTAVGAALSETCVAAIRSFGWFRSARAVAVSILPTRAVRSAIAVAFWSSGFPGKLVGVETGSGRGLDEVGRGTGTGLGERCS